MKVFLPWLREYLTRDLPEPSELAERLTFAGLEVEGIEEFGAGLAGVVVAQVELCEPHPEADRLKICKVFDGVSKRTVVCGAPNVRRGMKVPLAPPGTRLPGNLLVEKRRVRGVESAGMLLSASELGLWDDHSGLLDLGPKAPVGSALHEALDLSEPVLEIAATPNRPDALSHVGVAREIAAITNSSLRAPTARIRRDIEPSAPYAKVVIDEPERCTRYVAQVVEGVRIGMSPPWLCARLAAAGIRPINNVVDVTNYVLLELGHPLHAFDLDLLAESTIVVRLAKEGEVIETLDEVERKLHGSDLVIADAASPVAIAGVMGGASSEVTKETTRVLIESAWFEPTGVRRTARRHGLHSESSHRFERGADPRIPLQAATRAASLIRKIAGGRVVGLPIDVHPRPFEPLRVTLRFARTNEVLGLPIRAAEQVAILRRLGFKVLKRDRHSVELEVPSFRTEMAREIDLIEEVARIHGYDSIPATLPRRSLATAGEEKGQAHFDIASRLRDAAAAAGCREVVNYSFMSEDEIASLAPRDGEVSREARALMLSNPLSKDQAAMRTTVMVSLLANLRHNRRFQRGDLKLYEIGRAYLFDELGVISEPERFAALMTGRRRPLSWTTDGTAVDFYDIKGLVEAALERVGIDPASCSFETKGDDLPWLHPTSACHVAGPEGELLGWLGEIHPRVAGTFELPAKVFVAELEMEAISRRARLLPTYEGVPRFPPVLRDLAVVVDDSVPAARVRQLLEAPLKEAARAGVNVAKATLFDVYTGQQVGEGKRSLAYAIQYQSSDRTLTDSETMEIHEALIRRLQHELGAQLRS